MALYRSLCSLSSRASGLLRPTLAKPTLRRCKSSRTKTKEEEDYDDISAGTWYTVARILAVPSFAAYAYFYHIRPALDEGVPEGVHVFTWLIARCLMSDIREDDRMMDEHLRKTRDIADDCLIAKEQDIYNKIPLIMSGTPKNLEMERNRTLSDEVGPDGF